MRILLLPWNYLQYGGGVEDCVTNISLKLRNRNIKTIIVTRRISNNSHKIKRINKIFIFRIYPHLFWNSKQNTLLFIFRIIVNFPKIFGLAKLIRFFKIDIINLHYLSPSAIYIILIAKILKIKVIASLHGELTQAVYFSTKFEKWLFKILLKNVDYVTACSNSLLKDVLKVIPEISVKSTFVYNGISVNGSYLKKEYLEYAHKNRYILTIGNLWWYKGIDILLMAMRRVYDKGYDIDLIIVGDGGERNKLVGISKLLKMDDKIIFKGLINNELEKNRLILNCEFFVLPSRIEPFGIVNLEAMAVGKAIVATRTGGVPEIVEDGVNGILVEPYNDRALSEGIKRLLDDEELREKLGTNGKKMVEDPKFSWDNIAEQYIDIYNKVLREKTNL